ncbi:unnamed protein product [Diabrotica balteata]|uniref:C2H2-type domain-containing protein n=1 Tax=Diabrotica balteata TaxID=107213 RepID=A0A9N9SY19_DIABA|nr:unnamed protein product [Diabrotica balteata]
MTVHNKRHIFIVLGNFVCETCGKTYKHSRSLRKHERFECQKEPQFVCVYCPYKAKLRGNLRKHIMVKHREEWTSGAAKIYVQRRKERKMKNEISSYLRRPRGKGQFGCVCGKSYYEKKNLVRHQKLKCSFYQQEEFLTITTPDFNYD